MAGPGSNLGPMLMPVLLIMGLVIGGLILAPCITGGDCVLQPGAQVAIGDGVYSGPITPRMAHTDLLSASTTYNEGAHVQTRWLRNTGASGVPSTGYQLMTTGNNTFSSLGQDNNIVFIAIEGRTGGPLYLGVRETLDSNSGTLQQYSYVDYDNDGVSDHLFRVSFAGMGVSAGMTTLDLPINGKWYSYQAPTGAVQEPGAFLVNVGNSQNNTQVFRFRYSNADFDKAIVLREIHVRFNTSDTSQFTIDKVVIPLWDSNTQSFYTIELNEQDVDETVLASNSTYKFFFGSDLSQIQSGGNIFATKTGNQKYNDILVYVTWTIAENESIVLSCDLKFWTDDEIERRAIAEIAVHDEGPLA